MLTTVLKFSNLQRPVEGCVLPHYNQTELALLLRWVPFLVSALSMAKNESKLAQDCIACGR